MVGSDLDVLLSEQISFYRADAGPFEAWHAEIFELNGGGSFGASCRRDRHRILEDLQRFCPRGHVLEIAAGTGTFTGSLLQSADRVTAVDASPESLEIARAKLSHHSNRLNLVQADLFAWRPPERYDAIFFAYWLSHVPPSRFAAFWRLVSDALTETGKVFFVDSTSTGANPGTPGVYRERDDPTAQVSHRELAGRRYRVVKVARHADDLERGLARLGWQASLQLGERSIWGTVARRIA
jgi:SAM-dependent methyltransferase